MISILVPFRDADGTRTRAKDWILRRWAHFYPDAEIIVASDDGVDPFNKSMAVNKAAAQAKGDIYIILDADTWADPKIVEAAIEVVASDKAKWSVPCRRAMRLKQDASEQFMALDPTGPLPALSSRMSEVTGPVVGFLWVVSRPAFEKVGGMDERIRGWGGEDTLFTRAMTVINGVPRRGVGTLMSLWHDRPRDGRGQRIWVGQDRSKEQDKAALALAYGKARRPHEMMKVLER